MFEKAQPVPRALSGDEIDSDTLVGSLAALGQSHGGGALRALEWSELRAKLNAARDLRRVLRRDTRLNIEGGASSFGDAAATYFRAIEQDERIVNPDALEATKASNVMGCKPNQDTATGETRDNG